MPWTDPMPSAPPLNETLRRRVLNIQKTSYSLRLHVFHVSGMPLYGRGKPPRAVGLENASMMAPLARKNADGKIFSAWYCNSSFALVRWIANGARPDLLRTA